MHKNMKYHRNTFNYINSNKYDIIISHSKRKAQKHGSTTKVNTFGRLQHENTLRKIAIIML